MTREQFTQNLEEALEFHDVDLLDEEVDKFLDLNYNEDSSLNYWTFADFNSFAIDVATEGLRRACRLNDLYYESDDEEEYGEEEDE